MEFGAEAERKYAEIVDEGDTAYMFQTVRKNFFNNKIQYKMALFRGEENVKSLDGREMPLMKVISETLKYISNKAIEK